MRQFNICVLGRTGSGKTVYLSVLLEFLRRCQGRGSIVSSFTHRNSFTQEAWRDPYHDPIFVNGRLPGPTKRFGQADDLKEPLRFHMRLRTYVRAFYPLTQKRNLDLTIYDSAGEDQNSQSEFDRAHTALIHADGIMVLLSGGSFPNFTAHRHAEGLDRGTFQLVNLVHGYFAKGNSSGVTVPTAFMVTKLDEVSPKGEALSSWMYLKNNADHSDGFDVEHCGASHREIVDLLEKHGDQGLHGFVDDDRFARHMFFGVSSLGYTPERIVGHETQIDPEKIKPWNLFDPLFWIFYRQGLLVRK